MYLETKRKLHRDISYTNILLRNQEVDLPERAAVREHFMEQLGLSEIEKLRKDLKCREGLLIDFDYGAVLAELENEMAKLADGDMAPADQASENGKEDEENGEDEEDYETIEEEAQDPRIVLAPATKAPKPSGLRTVSFPPLNYFLYMLRIYAGDCSFHRD
jgi:serine/threonine protein kinase